MSNNITRDDLDSLIEYLAQDNPRLTQSENVALFEKEWSDWLGVKYSVFVNSGSSANLLSISILREMRGLGDIIVPTLTWVSDIASVIQCGYRPVFVDINRRTMGMSDEEVIRKITPDTKAVFLTHALGFNAISDKLLYELENHNIPLIEDVCESHGATFKDKRLGTFGLMSNFSFYYAHHMSTIEGGMISTNDYAVYQMLLMLRSHGMIREAKDKKLKQNYAKEFPDLHPEFIFAFSGYNVRSTELNAIIGRSQLKRLDENNKLRKQNFKLFLDSLDSEKYFTDFELEGSCNYAFPLILKHKNNDLFEKVTFLLKKLGVEYRRGTAGGGNQIRQPYLRSYRKFNSPEEFVNVDHIHFYGVYIGNYPNLAKDQIINLSNKLNRIR